MRLGRMIYQIVCKVKDGDGFLFNHIQIAEYLAMIINEHPLYYSTNCHFPKRMPLARLSAALTA